MLRQIAAHVVPEPAKESSLHISSMRTSRFLNSADGWTYVPDPARTPQFDQVAEINRQGRNLGPTLVRLLSTDLRMKMGRHQEGGSTVSNALPAGVAAWSAGADPYLTNISATNLGGKNNGLRGDVIIGYFKPLVPEFTNADHENDVYFMVVNGLSAETGSDFDCRQPQRSIIHYLRDACGCHLNGLPVPSLIPTTVCLAKTA